MRTALLGGLCVSLTIGTMLVVACTGDDPNTVVTPDVDAASSTDAGGGEQGEAGVAPCDAAEQPDFDHGLFVRKDGTGAGSPNAPFGSIAAAIAAVKSRSSDAGTADGGVAASATIYVDVGTYAEETLVASGLGAFVLDGGWKSTGSDWKRNCDPNSKLQTVVNIAADVGIALRGVHGPSRIENLALYVGVPKAGKSHIGVHAVDSGALLFRNVLVVAEVAASAEGSTAQLPSQSSNCSICVDAPAEGPAGGRGVPAGEGTFTTDGFVSGVGADGETGSPGASGAGKAGETRACTINCSQCGNPGLETRTGGTGGCGCGGAGGGGGKGGQGGHASVAILTDGVLAVEYSDVQAKAGGDGAAGAGGAAGTDGAAGAPSAAVQCYPRCCVTDPGDQICELPSAMYCPELLPSSAIASGPVGHGAKGGAGGEGGPGAGGPAYSVVLLGGARAEYRETRRAHGPGGSAVAPAPAGKAGVEFTQP